MAQGAPHARRHAPHQQRRRRDQLRDARLGPAAARLRRRQDPRAAGSIARRAKDGEKIVTLDGVERAARRPDAGHRRRRAAAGHRRRVRQRRRRGGRAHHRPGARGGQLQRPQHPAHRAAHAASAARPATASRRDSTRTSCPGASTWRRGCSPSCAAAPSRRARSTCGARRRRAPRLAYRPAKADALLGYAVPAQEQAGILRRLECAVDEGAASEAGGAPDAHRRPRVDGHAADVPPRPRARGRPHRGGRAHRRLRPGAGDAAAASHRPAASPGRSRCGAPCGAPWPAAASTRPSPTRSCAPDALDPLGLPAGDVRLAPVKLSNPMSVEQSVMRTMLLPGPRRGGAREHRPAQRPAQPLRASAACTCGTTDEPGAGARRRTRRRPAARAGGRRHRARRPAARPSNWTGRGRPTDFFTLKGVVEAALARRAPARRVRAAR